MGIDVWLGLKEVQYCECIGRDIGYGRRGEDVMLWSGVGGRLGVDLCGFGRVGGVLVLGLGLGLGLGSGSGLGLGVRVRGRVRVRCRVRVRVRVRVRF